MDLHFRMHRALILFLVFAGFAFQFPLSPAFAEKTPNELLAGVHRNFPPQYSIDEKTGKPTGFAIDIMDEVARRAGLKIRYVVFDEWPPLTQALIEGRINIIPNSGIIEERKADIDFTDPVEAFNISIFVRETTTDIHGIDDLQGRRVAVVIDNKGLSIVQEYSKAIPVIFKSLDEALLSLLSGNTDALVYPEQPVLLITWRLQSQDVTGRDEEMFFHGALLVPDGSVAALEGITAEWNTRHENQGLSLELSGPWPPYHFAPVL